MTTTYRHTATGTIHRPGQIVGGVQTHASMSDAAWADLGCVPYTAPPPEPPPDAAAILSTRAAEVLSRPGAVEAVQAVLARVGEVAAAGVAITDWSYQGVEDAVMSQMTDDAIHDYPYLKMSIRLNTAWERVVLHAGGKQQAYELWPAMVATVTSETPSA